MKSSKTDAQLQQDVNAELAWDTRLLAGEINVFVDNSVVTLTGTVATYSKKLAAEDAAHRVSGVLDVANGIVVSPAQPEQRTDTKIAAAIRQVLNWDAFVPEDQIRTTVTNGMVTLEGIVESIEQRRYVAHLVGNVTGVCGIDNLLRVQRPDVPTPAVHQAIRNALERRGDHAASKIDLDVDGGHVTVSGPVGSWSERQAILGAIRGTRGVEAVIDHLRQV